MCSHYTLPPWCRSDPETLPSRFRWGPERARDAFCRPCRPARQGKVGWQLFAALQGRAGRIEATTPQMVYSALAYR